MWQDWTQEDETNEESPSLNKSPLETHFENKEELELWPLTVLPVLTDHSESHQVFN